MQEHKCEKGCCSIFVKKYEEQQDLIHRRRLYKKAGVFIYDPKLNRVLLVQSRGHLWGPPKGTLELGETDLQCALREVKEETGLDVSHLNFSRATRIKNKAMYFYLEKNMCPVTIQEDVDDNDVNGITWIKMNCLKQCIRDGYIVLNQHSKILFLRFMDRIFPKNEFVKVVRRRKKS